MAKELKNIPIYLVIGGPGCGKGTQCEKIKEEFKLTHVSTGDLLRAEVEKKTADGNKAAELMKKGELVPTTLLVKILKSQMIEMSKTSSGFLIDGYPREFSQISIFEKQVAKPTKVIYFKVSPETMNTRLLGRAKDSGRADDNEEVIKVRINTFNTTITKITDYYNKKKSLVEIDAEKNPDEVFESVKLTFAK